MHKRSELIITLSSFDYINLTVFMLPIIINTVNKLVIKQI